MRKIKKGLRDMSQRLSMQQPRNHIECGTSGNSSGNIGKNISSVV